MLVLGLVRVSVRVEGNLKASDWSVWGDYSEFLAPMHHPHRRGQHDAPVQCIREKVECVGESSMHKMVVEL